MYSTFSDLKPLSQPRRLSFIAFTLNLIGSFSSHQKNEQYVL